MIITLAGLQWGDEGKGKIADLLSHHADLVIRFQGGNNAGHTIKYQKKKFILHHIPSGICQPKCRVLLGSGMVIDLPELCKEIEEIQKQGIDCKKRIFISDLAHLILPIHKIKDRLSEQKKNTLTIGTTGKGIGPAYTDKVSRKGIRICDLRVGEDFKKMSLTKIKELYQKNEKVKIIYDAPLLIEAGVCSKMQAVILMITSFENILKRLNQKALLKGARISEGSVRQRIQYQIKPKDAKKFARFIIDGNTSLEVIKKQVEIIHKKLLVFPEIIFQDIL